MLFAQISFVQPIYFLLLLALIPYVLWHFIWKRRREGRMLFFSTNVLKTAPKTWKNHLVHLPFALRVFAFILLVVVLARPQSSGFWRERTTEGIDMMLTMDISTSMLLEDVSPNRITVAKEVAYDFISKHKNDQIGLTLFGGEAFTPCPLTGDHSILLKRLGETSCELQAEGIIQPGTAIGMGVASAVTHLEHSKTKSKVIILLTDGANNTGDISPLMAAQMAKDSGIRVYTILLGTDAVVNMPVATLPNGEVYSTNIQTSTDPQTLQQIASLTGGTFYRATSRDALTKVYEDIGKLEKTKLIQRQHQNHEDVFQPFLLLAVLCLLLEMLLRLVVLRRLP